MTILNNIRKLFIGTAIESFLARKAKNKEVGTFWTKLVPGNTLYPEKYVKSYSRNGIDMDLDLSDYVEHYYYYGFKDENLDYLFSFANKGDTVIDVGANIGFTSMRFGQIVGENGKVISFEPDDQNHKKCLKNLTTNHFKNVTLIKKGLGSAPGSFKLEIATPSNRGGNRINNSYEGSNFSVITVVKLDDELADIDRINLIKIDVEGFEMEVLKGASGLLKKFKPVVFCEIDDRYLALQNASVKQLVQFMKELGYNKVLDALTKTEITSSSEFNGIHTDFVFFAE